MTSSSIYSYSLCIALPLMLFFGFYFMLAKTPEKAIFGNYLRSRRIMGAAILLLAANYSVHFFFGIRFKSADAAITMNLSTYFLCYWLFSSALTTLLDRFYITRKRLRTHICLWISYSALSCIVLLIFLKGDIRTSAMLVLAACLIVYGLVLTKRLLHIYHRVTRIFKETHADDLGAYIKWLSVFTYWVVTYGVGCGLLTFLPDEYIYIWILSSVPLYIYMFLCYLNYMLFYEQVENAMESEVTAEDDISCGAQAEQTQKQETPAYHAKMAEKIQEWIDTNGFVRSGLTIKELSDLLYTNRTYLSEFIKTTYAMSFRDWITGLRIEYAKRLLTQYPKLTVADISERSGFISPSHFTRLFKENAGCTPVKWRKKENK